MKSSRIINNLTRIGIGLGLLFPLGSLGIDLWVKDLSFTVANIGSLYALNPLHWIILSAPIMLGGSFYYLAKRIANRETYLMRLAENEKEQMGLISGYITELGSGNLSASLPGSFSNKELAGTLHAFRDKLVTERDQSEKRQWVNEGLAKFGEILRAHENLDELGYAVVKNLVEYCKLTQGGIFVLTGGDQPQLELRGCYAYQRKKFLEKRIDPGQGLIGQCFMEREKILLYKVPDDYVHITSGLGDANPTCLILLPLKTEDSIEGVIEMAGFRRFEPHELEFLENVCESTATVFKNVKNAEQTKRLLTASQEQAEMMRSQEEEMRQNMEELAATQEEMQRKEQEFIRQIENYKARVGE
ncbi:GAF domain-containing protein [Oscillatoria amoena NRMC-F 0135]|nr:GAF domain-containing protein [Oscillatoria amoena NRMC-F 0135]